MGSLLVQREIAAVNRKIPGTEQLSYSFMYPGKMQKTKAADKPLSPVKAES